MTPSSPSPAATLILKPGTAWQDAWRRCLAAAPEAFQDDRVRNLWDVAWHPDGRTLPAVSPVDGTPVAGPPRLDAPAARTAVRAALDSHRAWRHVPLPERRARVSATLDALTEHRELLALLLVWEIGKPWRLAQADVDRAIDGVRWYVDHSDRLLAGRTPLAGPVSNIASWNYPMSVLVHAMLVQALAGNAVIAKTPTDGGVSCLTLACALAAREGLPLTLLSGSGSELSEPSSGRPRSAASPSSGDGTPAPGSPPPSPTSASGTSSNRRASTPGGSGTTRTGRPSRSYPSSSTTASSAAPPTPASSSSEPCSRTSWRPTSRPYARSAPGTPSRWRPPRTRCPTWTSAP